MRDKRTVLVLYVMFWIAPLFLASTVMTAQALSPQPQSGAEQAGQVAITESAAPAQAPVIEISAGDLLQITVFDTPELSAQIRVDQQGKIDLPWGGKLHVAGMVPGQLAEKLQTMLVEQQILRQPHEVTVFIQEYATQGVKVLGQVKSPGIYPF